MKLVITHRVEKQMKKIGLEPTQVLQFLMKHLPCSKRLIRLCSPLKGVSVYKVYFDNLRRGVFFIHGETLIYPVYIGNKRDLITANITVHQVRRMAEIWQDDFLSDIRKNSYQEYFY